LQSHPIEDNITADRPVVALIEKEIRESGTEDEPATILQIKNLFSAKQVELIKSGTFLETLPADIADSAAIIAELQKDEALVSVLNIETLRKYYDDELMDTWNGQTGWRWMFAAESVWAFLFFILIYFVPNSPRWLCRVDRDEKARGVLKKIGGDEYAGVYLADIKDTLKNSHHIKEFAELLKPKMSKIIVIGMTISIFSQWCGMNVIFNYAHDIFKAAGYGVSAVLTILLIVGITNFLFTIVAMLTIDKLGRKLLIFIGAITLGISFTTLGFCFYTQSQGFLIVAMVLISVAFFASSIGPVTWVLLSEIFPNRIRGLATSIAVMAMWVANFILALTFPSLFKNLGYANTFWLYAGVSLAGAFFIYFCVPETKGKTLEQIERELVD
jgi:sugar porter (SP) family MFS transporter